MDSNRLYPNRRSIRLCGFDYSQPGAYYITICSADRQPIFGAVRKGKMHLSEFGQIAEEEWRKTPSIRKEIRLDEFQVMPDHFHAIAWITDHENVGAAGWPPEGKVWQRGYFERIIRNEVQLDRFRAYIQRNPMREREQVTGNR